MYPNHWFLGGEDHTNYGLSMDTPEVITDSGNVVVSTQRDHVSGAKTFSISTDISFAEENGCFKFRIIMDNLDVLIWGRQIVCELMGGTTIVKTIMTITSSTAEDWKFSYDLTDIVGGDTYHLAILFDDHKVWVYVDGTEKESVSERFSESEDALDLSEYDDRTLLFVVKSNDVSYQNLRFYDSKISKQQVLEDRSGLCVHYLFDGSSLIDETYVKEYDVSGGHSYDATVVGEEPLELTSTGNHLRDYSVSIPTGSYVEIPCPAYDQTFFINFWIYPVEGDSNVDLLTLGDVKISLYTFSDVGYEVVLSVGEDSNYDPMLTQSVSNSKWHMISVRRVLGELDQIILYVDGVESGRVTLTESLVETDQVKIYSFPGVLSDYRQYFRAPTDAELQRMLRGDAFIDDRGTFHASKLVEDTSMETFGFTKGAIKAKGFDFLGESDSHTAIYDIDSGIFKLRDYKQE